MLNISVYFSTYRLSSFKHLSHLSQASECPMQRTILSAVQATDERLIAPSVSDENFCPPSIISSAQKDDS